jgi:hypothetical protein
MRHAALMSTLTLALAISFGLIDTVRAPSKRLTPGSRTSSRPVGFEPA